MPGLPVVFMTGNPECFNDYPFRTDVRLVAKPLAGADLLKVMAELRPVMSLHPATEAALTPDLHLQAA